MLQAIIKKELLNNLLNLRFSLAYFLATFLLVGSGALMLGEFLNEKKNYDLNTAFHARNLDAISSATHFVHSEKIITRRPFPSKIFAVGGERDAAGRAEVSITSTPFFLSDFKRNPLVTLFPTLDMVFVVGIILSLLIFMLTFDSISGEREEGTLKVLLSCPVPRDILYIGKWLGGTLSLTIPLVTAWLAVLVLLFIMSPHLLVPDELIRMLLIFAMCVVYVVVMFSLSMAISVIARTSSTSILILLIVWSLGILAIPALSIPGGYLLSRAEGVDVLEAEICRSAQTGHRELMEKFSEKHREMVSPGEFSLDFHREIMRMHWGFVGDLMTKATGKFTNNELQGEAVSRWLSRISPFGCLQNASVTISGTGMYNEVGLRKSLQDYYTQTIDYAIQVSRDNGQFDQVKAPRFTYFRPRIVDTLKDSLVDIAILLLMGGLFFLYGYYRFLRMDAQ